MIEYLNTRRRQGDEGFTLIELLISIVVVGILTTVVIVGIGSLTDSGETATCQASADAFKAASVVHYANNDSVWPTTLAVMVTDGEVEVPANYAAVTGTTATINGKTLTMTVGPPPTFACS